VKFNKDLLRTLCDERGISYPGKSQKLDLVWKLFTAVSCAVCKVPGMSDRFFSSASLSNVLTVPDMRRV
jgi:hypothetical protein